MEEEIAGQKENGDETRSGAQYGFCFMGWLRAAGCCVGRVRRSAEKKDTGEGIALSDKELNAFVKACVENQNIRLSYAPVLENTKDPKEKKRIQDEANTTMVRQALDTHELTPKRHNRIFASVNGNEELLKRVLKKVEEERKKS